MKNYTNIRKMFNHIFISHFLLNVTYYLCNIVSGYIAGNYIDSIAVSTTSLINPINLIIINIAYIFATAGEILCGKYMGVGDKKSINKTFTNSIMFALIFGVILTLVFLVFSKEILILLDTPSDMFMAAQEYLRGYGLGIIAYMLLPILENFLHMENEGKHVIISVVLLTTVYTSLGLLFFRVFNLSYFAFGLINSISEIVTVLFLLIKIIKNRDEIKFDIKLADFSSIKQFITLGLPSGSAGIVLAIRNIILNALLITTGGSLAVAASSIAFDTACLNDAIISSIVQTIIITTSLCLGEKNNDDFESITKYFLFSIWPTFISLTLLEILLSKYTCNIFTIDQNLLPLAIKASRLYLSSNICEIFCLVMVSIFTIFEYKKFVNFFNIVHCSVIHVLFAFLTKNLFGMYSVFSSYIFTEIASTLIILTFIVSTNKKIPSSYDEFTLVKDELKKANRFCITLKNPEDIKYLSENASLFFEKNGIDHRRSNLAGLTLEELSNDIFENGFTKKETKNKHIDIFGYVENNEILIRIRDNAIAFDPNTRSYIFNPEDPCKNVGIRIVSKISKEMTYQNIFGFNNNIIKI